MAKKSPSTALHKTAKKIASKTTKRIVIHKHITFSYAPNMLAEIEDFFHNHDDLATDEYGGIEVKTKKSDDLFKISHVKTMCNCHDGFLGIELNADNGEKIKDALYLYQKDNIDRIEIDFCSKIYKTSDKIDKDSQRVNNYMG